MTIIIEFAKINLNKFLKSGTCAFLRGYDTKDSKVSIPGTGISGFKTKIMEKKQTILIADDEFSARSILEKLITDQGYNVITASDGHTARENILRSNPDLIILDNYMPGISGNDICREIKSNPETRFIPVITLTGYTETPDKIEAIEAGSDDFINKPYKAVELLTRIKSLLKVKALYDELDSAEGVIFALARAIEAKDTYTQGHTERVSQFAILVGHHFGLSNDDQSYLFKGGILHDIGKIAVPDAILNKPGMLTDEEFAVIRSHPDRGEKICQPLNSIKSALTIIRHHHEKMDGTGYPDKLSGENIPVVARIMAIVDVYDALTTNRSYRAAMPQAKAFSILDNEADKGWWDKRILAEFKKLVVYV
ncbi:MAG: response regulator [Elusimicrobia bacterium]|nr:response regulator [Candidatus Liberimonas magnetica]